ncbi:hypothetical protein HA38_09225 [Pantoea allii]|nr:hypothetical protein HA38_09225 [Pantoea allii]
MNNASLSLRRGATAVQAKGVMKCVCSLMGQVPDHKKIKKKGLSQIKASAAAVAQSCQLVSEIKRKKFIF